MTGIIGVSMAFAGAVNARELDYGLPSDMKFWYGDKESPASLSVIEKKAALALDFKMGGFFVIAGSSQPDVDKAVIIVIPKDFYTKPENQNLAGLLIKPEEGEIENECVFIDRYSAKMLILNPLSNRDFYRVSIKGISQAQTDVIEETGCIALQRRNQGRTPAI